MKHEFTQKVYYADTDAFGVVWHGSYLRWLEAGRVELCEKLGFNLADLEKKDIVLPVTNMNVRYKASAKIDHELIIETTISKVTPITIVFNQTIKDKNTGTLYIQAEFEIVAINNKGKLYRRLPQELKDAFERASGCKD